MHNLLIIFCTSNLLNAVSALYSGTFCPQSCELAINYVTFNDTDAWLSRKIRSCRSELRLTSLYLCFDQFCADDGEKEKWIEINAHSCVESAGVTLPGYHDVVDHWTAHDKAGVRRLSAEEALTWPTLDESVLPSMQFFARAFMTTVRGIRSHIPRLIVEQY
jgi:replicative superfamily II helicase